MLRIAMLSFAHVHADGYARQIVNHPEAEITCVGVTFPIFHKGR